MATLIDWFERKDYGEGVALLGKYVKNKILIQNLSRKRNPGKLEYELLKIAERNKLVPEKPEVTKVEVEDKPLPAVEETKGTIEDPKQLNPDELPAHLKSKWHENQDSYKEIRSLHEKLKLMENGTTEDRQPLTERLASLDDVIRANWAEIDVWVPGQENEPVISATEIKPIDHKRINANRKFISSNLRKLENRNFKGETGVLVLEVQKRVNELLASGEQMNIKTIDELKKFGIYT